jgi:hypothetical protein
MGRSNADLGYGGLVLAASSESVGLLFRMLQDANRVQILSRPSLMTIDNNISVVNVGQSVPTLTGTTNGINGVTTGVNYVNTGLTMQIQPRTNQDGLINMIVAVSRSNIDPSGGIPIGFQIDGQGNSQPISAPIFNQTLAQTRVTAYDGQTVILGGLITKERASRSRRIPFLADIPLAGWLFRYDSESERRTELLVVMTPRVINYNDPNKLDMIKQVESSRMSWCLADILNIYGDVGLSEGNGLWGPSASPVIYPDVNPTGDVGQAGPAGRADANQPTYLTPSLDNAPQSIPTQDIPMNGNWNGEYQVNPYGSTSNNGMIQLNGQVLSNGTINPQNGIMIEEEAPLYIQPNGIQPNGPQTAPQGIPALIPSSVQQGTLQSIPPQSIPPQSVQATPSSSRIPPKTLLRNNNAGSNGPSNSNPTSNNTSNQPNRYGAVNAASPVQVAGVIPNTPNTNAANNNNVNGTNYQPITIAPSPYVIPTPNSANPNANFNSQR